MCSISRLSTLVSLDCDLPINSYTVSHNVTFFFSFEISTIKHIHEKLLTSECNNLPCMKDTKRLQYVYSI